MAETVTINGREFKVVGSTPRQAAAASPKKRSKYGNRKVVVDGTKIDSRREARRWTELRIMEKAGLIRDLERQPVFVLAPAVRIAGEPRKRPAMRVTLDFRYTVAKTGEIVCEDVKSPSTAKVTSWRMRQHLLKHIHGIDVRVVK